MKVGLISTYINADALGPRYISSFLRRAGHDVRLICLTGKSARRADRPYPPALLDELIDLLRETDVVGVSLMTNTYFRAVEVSRAVRGAGLKAPIVWGGVHPTVAPDSCVEHADWICIGEGELPMLQLIERLATGRDPTGVPGMAAVRDGQLQRFDVCPLPDDLDAYPFPDCESDGHLVVVRNGHLVPADEKLMRHMLKRYRLLSTRGCPYKCTFCNNAAIQRLYQGRGRWVRKRSGENVVAELEAAIERFPSIRSVKIVDDLFFVRGEDEMQRFAELYRQRVGLPFEVDAHPATISRAKVEGLLQAGLYRVHMGIQSGSEKTNFGIYNRPTSQKQIAAALDMLAGYPQLEMEYHYIVANPFEPEEQIVETLYFAAQHHRGNYKIDLFPLAFFPGTPLYERALAEGIIHGSQHELYGRVWRQSWTWAALGSYLVVLLAMVLRMKRWHLPAGLVRRFVSVATSRPVRMVMDRKWLPVLLVVGWVLLRVGRNVIYQPFIRPFTKRRRLGRRASATDSATGQKQAAAARA